MSAGLCPWVKVPEFLRVGVKKGPALHVGPDTLHFTDKTRSCRKPGAAGPIVPFVKIRKSMKRCSNLKMVAQLTRSRASGYKRPSSSSPPRCVLRSPNSFKDAPHSHRNVYMSQASIELE